jgi:acetolactate synthase small subunit
MSQSHNFTIHSFNAPTVLPRVALLFSKRRLSIKRLEMHELEGGEHTMMGLDARCDAETATKVAAQIRRIVEVCDVQVATADAYLYAQRA